MLLPASIMRVPMRDVEEAGVAVLNALQTRKLGTSGVIDVLISTDPKPWAINVDTLVVSAGPSGFGELGQALEEAFPSLGLAGDPQLRDLAAGNVMTLDLRNRPVVPTSGPSRRTSRLPADLAHVVVARINDSDTPPTIDGITLTALAAIEAAAASGAHRVGVSLLGTGVLGLDIATIANAMVPAVRTTLAQGDHGSIEQLVFVTKDSITADAIAAAWTAAETDANVNLQMLADGPIDDLANDVLGYREYATALAFVIDHPKTGTPLTIAINAPWGAGKTSLAKLVARVLKDRPRENDPPIPCWFNAWYHDDAPNIVSALAASVARAAARERSVLRRLRDPLPSQLLSPRGKRRRHFVTASLTVVAAAIALAFTIAGSFEELTPGGQLTLPVVITLIPVAASTLAQVRGTATDVGSLVRSPRSALTSGALIEVREDLGRLVHQATRRGRDGSRPENRRRLVVYIDDLERCQPARSIEVCEAVSSLLSLEDVVTVLIGDIQTLAIAADIKYKDLAPRYRGGSLSSADETPAASFGQLYLEKIVQFRFDIPTHDYAELRALAKRMLPGRQEERGRQAVAVPDEPDMPGVAEPPVPMDAAAPDEPEGNETPPVPSPAPDDAAALSIYSRFRRWVTSPLARRRARLRRLRDAENARLIEQGGMPPSSSEDQERARALLEEQRATRLIDGRYVWESYNAVAEMTRPLPRDVKRLLNRLRFTLKLCNDRELIKPRLLSTPAIGKWALVSERWPDLQSAISQDPSRLGWLEENLASGADFSVLMKELAPAYANSRDLYTLIVTRPMLGAVAASVANFRPPKPDD
jgi:hypothetical protein